MLEATCNVVDVVYCFKIKVLAADAVLKILNTNIIPLAVLILFSEGPNSLAQPPRITCQPNSFD